MSNGTENRIPNDDLGKSVWERAEEQGGLHILTMDYGAATPEVQMDWVPVDEFKRSHKRDSMDEEINIKQKQR